MGGGPTNRRHGGGDARRLGERISDWRFQREGGRILTLPPFLSFKSTTSPRPSPPLKRGGEGENPVIVAFMAKPRFWIRGQRAPTIPQWLRAGCRLCVIFTHGVKISRISLPVAKGNRLISGQNTGGRGGFGTVAAVDELACGLLTV